MINSSNSTDSPFSIANGMEDDILAVRDFASALVMMCEGRHDNEWNSVARLAYAIIDHVENLKKSRKQLCQALQSSNLAAASYLKATATSPNALPAP